jgi:hypothetical protein
VSDGSHDQVDELLAEFERFRKVRYQRGVEKYGERAFLNNDNIQDLFEELADMANYASFIYVQLRFLSPPPDFNPRNTAGSGDGQHDNATD